jgi:hypothetical protein
MQHEPSAIAVGGSITLATQGNTTMQVVNGHTVPTKTRLFVEPGWFVDAIASLPECELAVATLKEAVERIEKALAEVRVRPEMLDDREWFRRANGALKLKKLALIEAEKIHARLKKEDMSGKLAEIRDKYHTVYGKKRHFEVLRNVGTYDGHAVVYRKGDGGACTVCDCSEHPEDGALIAELLNFASEL